MYINLLFNFNFSNIVRALQALFIGKIVKYAHRENVNSQTASGRWILDIFDLGYKSILDITRSWI